MESTQNQEQFENLALEVLRGPDAPFMLEDEAGELAAQLADRIMAAGWKPTDAQVMEAFCDAG